MRIHSATLRLEAGRRISHLLVAFVLLYPLSPPAIFHFNRAKLAILGLPRPTEGPQHDIDDVMVVGDAEE